ncbi:hypothetical protein [Paenibacillus sp. FSL L8-0708]|uniref:hypothetical protein n=1 Tax=Paenibacillus sp. FSL L8-0708 TaxID=2975311 RepID=UPI0030F5B461
MNVGITTDMVGAAADMGDEGWFMFINDDFGGFLPEEDTLAPDSVYLATIGHEDSAFTGDLEYHTFREIEISVIRFGLSTEPTYFPEHRTLVINEDSVPIFYWGGGGGVPIFLDVVTDFSHMNASDVIPRINSYKITESGLIGKNPRVPRWVKDIKDRGDMYPNPLNKMRRDVMLHLQPNKIYDGLNLYVINWKYMFIRSEEGLWTKMNYEDLTASSLNDPRIEHEKQLYLSMVELERMEGR